MGIKHVSQRVRGRCWNPEDFTLDGLLFHRRLRRVVSSNCFGRNVNQLSIRSVVCQVCDKYEIWQCLHTARISVIYFFKYI